MENILKKPYTSNEYFEFKLKADANNKVMFTTNVAAYALSEYETVIDDEIVDLREDKEYIKQKRLEAIELELIQTDIDYQTVINTPVQYSNGFYYKPRYVQDSYVLLLAAGIFPITIWDATELNPSEMSQTDLTQLSMFLKGIAEPAFQERKEKRQALLLEKEELQN